MNTYEIILTCTPMTYCARADEDCFFEWLKKMNFVSIVGGVGKELYVKIVHDLSKEETFELLGFFQRYGLERDPLKAIINNNNKGLVEDFLNKKLFVDKQEESNAKILICSPLLFYTNVDKNCFFEWLKKMNFVESYHTIDNAVYVTIVQNISVKDTWEILGFFRRYNLNSNYLTAIVNKKNKKLIQDYLARKLFTRVPKN